MIQNPMKRHWNYSMARGYGGGSSQHNIAWLVVRQRCRTAPLSGYWPCFREMVFKFRRKTLYTRAFVCFLKVQIFIEHFCSGGRWRRSSVSETTHVSGQCPSWKFSKNIFFLAMLSFVENVIGLQSRSSKTFEFLRDYVPVTKYSARLCGSET